MKSQNTNNARPLAGTKKLVKPSVILLAAVLLSLATAQAAVYNFQLQGRNTAADGSGNSIAMTGAGTFDTTKNTVKATGSFTTYDSVGAVVSKGNWSATTFVGFEAGGGVNRGFQTGTLAIGITLSPKGGAPVTGVPMTVHCDEDEVPGPAESGNEDGITVGSYTESTGGFTLFQIKQP